MAITFEQVAAAAEKIKANNASATCQSVREVLGSGSMATISKMLRRYKNEQPTAQSDSSVTLPDTLKKAMYDELERYSAERVSVVRDELNEALQTIESIENESETLDALCVEKDAIIEDHAKTIADLTEKNSEQARKIESLIDEKTSLKSLSDSLTLDLAESKASLSAVERERDMMHANSKTQLEKIEALTDKSTAQSIETQRLTTMNANLESQYSEKSNALKAALDALEVKVAELNSEKQKTASIESKVAVLENQSASLNEYKTEQKETIRKLEGVIQTQKDEHKKEIETLHAQKEERENKR